MIIGVTGYKGKLGSALIGRGCVPLECDVTDPIEVERAIGSVKPNLIIHCAAIGNNKVDWCETEEGKARSFAVNVGGALYVRWAFRGPVIFISTSYIFDGKRGPYSEFMRGVPEPVNGYGFTKLAMEAAVMSEDDTTIVRTVGLYGGSGDDFVKTIIAALSLGDEINALRTLEFNPTYVPHLAEALMVLAEMRRMPRVVNVAGSDIMSRYEFALQVAYTFGLDAKLVRPCDKVDAWVAPRPRKAGLVVKYARSIGLPIYTTKEGLQAMKDIMYASA